MKVDPIRICALVVGLRDVVVVGVVDEDRQPLQVHVETARPLAGCRLCGSVARVKDRAEVALVDLPAFGRAAVLVWHKRRWRCPDGDCAMGTWTEQAPAIAAARARVTDRAGRWITTQVGRAGRSVAEVARELGCDWHTVMDAVVAYGTPLVEDPDRIGRVTALGLDETLFARVGPWRTRLWCTSIVNVGSPSQLLDVVEGRTARVASTWIDARPQTWRNGVSWATLDLSGPYRKAFDDSLPAAVQVADPFHVVKLANSKLDECRRRVQNETHGHRGRRDDPLYRSRRLLTKGHERLSEAGNRKLMGFLEAGDPRGEVRMCWHAKETLRGFYVQPAEQAAGFLDELTADLVDNEMPVEVRSLGRTMGTWRNQILAWHRARVSNGPTEAANNLVKRIKRIGFGFRKFRHYRLRVLLYAGRPNWDLLATVDPAEIR